MLPPPSPPLTVSTPGTHALIVAADGSLDRSFPVLGFELQPQRLIPHSCITLRKPFDTGPGIRYDDVSIYAMPGSFTLMAKEPVTFYSIGGFAEHLQQDADRKHWLDRPPALFYLLAQVAGLKFDPMEDLPPVTPGT